MPKEIITESRLKWAKSHDWYAGHAHEVGTERYTVFITVDKTFQGKLLPREAHSVDDFEELLSLAGY